jgi:hypothetical protein
MMLGKSLALIFGNATIKAMLADLDFHLDEIKSDPSPPDYLANLHQLRDLLAAVQKERIADLAA